MLYVNPGAAGNHGFHHTKTLVRFEVVGKEIKKYGGNRTGEKRRDKS